MSEGINFHQPAIEITGSMTGSSAGIRSSGFTAADKPKPIETTSPRPIVKELDFSELAAKVDAAKATGWKGALVKIMLLFGSSPEKLKASEFWGTAATKILDAQAAKDEALETIRKTFAEHLNSEQPSSSLGEVQLKVKIAEQRTESRNKVMNILREEMQAKVGFNKMTAQEREKLDQKFDLLHICHQEMMQAKEALQKLPEGSDSSEALKRLKSAIDRMTESMKEVFIHLPADARSRVQLACVTQGLRSSLPQ